MRTRPERRAPSGLFAPPLRSRPPRSHLLFTHHQAATMRNEEGDIVDLYIPRKCSWTNRLIHAKDHATIQVNIGHLNESGVYNGQYTTLCLSGFIRSMGDGDSALDRLWQKKKVELGQL